MTRKFSYILFCTVALSALVGGKAVSANEPKALSTPALEDSSSENISVETITPIPFSPHLSLEPSETHSGLRLPRWVSLKYDKVNGRKGPGKNYPHLWTFARKGAPVIVVNEMDHWRKIRDIEGGESWVRSVALSGQSMAIVTRKTPLLKSKKANSRRLAELEPNVLLNIEDCDQDFCRVEIDLETPKGKKSGPKGYVRLIDIWGRQKF